MHTMTNFFVWHEVVMDLACMGGNEGAGHSAMAAFLC